MKPFALYTDIEPALDRPDIFLAVTSYAAEPEPYRDLLHFPDNQTLVATLAQRLVNLRLTTGVVPRLTNVGLHEERLFLAFTLGLVTAAPVPRRLSEPIPPRFWLQLDEGLSELHRQGVTYGHLRDDTVAIVGTATPLLFDLTGLDSVQSQPPDVDIAARRALHGRWV